jgi:hypothetical protein
MTHLVTFAMLFLLTCFLRAVCHNISRCLTLSLLNLLAILTLPIFYSEWI